MLLQGHGWSTTISTRAHGFRFLFFFSSSASAGRVAAPARPTPTDPHRHAHPRARAGRRRHVPRLRRRGAALGRKVVVKVLSPELAQGQRRALRARDPASPRSSRPTSCRCSRPETRTGCPTTRCRSWRANRCARGSTRRRAADRARSSASCATSRARSPTRTSAASSTATSSPTTCSLSGGTRGRHRLRHRQGDQRRAARGAAERHAHAARHVDRHAGVHGARAGGRRSGRSTTAPTSTRSACMAYELLAGRPPFAVARRSDAGGAHGRTPAPIAELRADVPQRSPTSSCAASRRTRDERPQTAARDRRGARDHHERSGTAVQPPSLSAGADIFRRALVVYAVAFIAVAVLAKVAIVGIGLPDWVFPGALIVMALGLPVILLTGYVQRVRVAHDRRRRPRRAAPMRGNAGDDRAQCGTARELVQNGARRRRGVGCVCRARRRASWASARLGVGPFGDAARIRASERTRANFAHRTSDLRTPTARWVA